MNSETGSNGLDQIESIKEIKDIAGRNWEWVYWDGEIQKALKNEEDYVKDAEKVIKIYKSKPYSVTDAQQRRDVRPAYNILYSNVETLKPLVFSRLPNPRIRRRNLEKSNVNKLLSVLLERTVKRILEETNAQVPIEKARDNYLLVNRGVVRVLFKQEIIKLPESEEEFTEATDTIDTETRAPNSGEELGEKQIKLEFVSWKNIVFSPAETWEDVYFVAFRHSLTQAELKEKFGVYKGKKIALGEEANENIINDRLQPESYFEKAEVWEIWDKRTNEIIFWTTGYKDGLLNKKKDDYKLRDFFNIPRPLGIDSGFDDINQPIPDYIYYEDQAKELDKISNRILAILPYISVGGMYNSSMSSTDADNFLQAIETYFPVEIKLDAKISDMIYERDISKLASVLQILYQERQQSLAAIQQVSGISDIVRGQTEAQETATAQELKGNFAVSRIQPKQKAMEFFCRDIIRIIVELVAENFDTFELAESCQMKVFDMDKLSEQFAKEQQEQDIQRVQSGQPPMTPEEKEAFYQSKFKPYQNEIKSGQATTVNLLTEANKILKNDKLRGWAIEVETDSTIKVDQNAERQSVLDFAAAIAKVSSDFLPAVQQGLITKDAFRSVLGYIMRRFDGSEEVEELLSTEDDSSDQMAQQQMQMQQAIMQKDMELKERAQQTNEFKAQADAAYDQGKLKIDADKLNLDENKAILEAETASDEISSRTAALNKKIESATLNEMSNE